MEHAFTSGLLLPGEMFARVTVGKGWEQSQETVHGWVKSPVPAAPQEEPQASTEAAMVMMLYARVLNES